MKLAQARRRIILQSIKLVVRADVFKHRPVLWQQMKNDPQVVGDGKAPEFRQLARKLVRPQARVERVGGENFDTLPKLFLQILLPGNPLLEGALERGTEKDLRHFSVRDFFSSLMELENLGLRVFSSARLRRWSARISLRRSSIKARSSKDFNSSFSSMEQLRTFLTSVANVALMAVEYAVASSRASCGRPPTHGSILGVLSMSSWLQRNFNAPRHRRWSLTTNRRASLEESEPDPARPARWHCAYLTGDAAELIVINQLLDRRIVATDRAEQFQGVGKQCLAKASRAKSAFDIRFPASMIF